MLPFCVQVCVASFVLWYEAVQGLKPKEPWLFALTCSCQLESAVNFISLRVRFSFWAFSQERSRLSGCFCVDIWINRPCSNALLQNCWTFSSQLCLNFCAVLVFNNLDCPFCQIQKLIALNSVTFVICNAAGITTIEGDIDASTTGQGASLK